MEKEIKREKEWEERKEESDVDENDIKRKEKGGESKKDDRKTREQLWNMKLEVQWVRKKGKIETASTKCICMHNIEWGPIKHEIFVWVSLWKNPIIPT